MSPQSLRWLPWPGERSFSRTDGAQPQRCHLAEHHRIGPAWVTHSLVKAPLCPSIGLLRLDDILIFTTCSDVPKANFPVLIFVESAIDGNEIQNISDLKKRERDNLHWLKSYAYLYYNAVTILLFFKTRETIFVSSSKVITVLGRNQ